MKKLIEKLFSNEIFKKITMGVMFVIMCSFACFLNWKAVVGAEGENTASAKARIWFSNYDPSVATIAYAGGSVSGPTYENIDIPSTLVFEVTLQPGYTAVDRVAHFTALGGQDADGYLRYDGVGFSEDWDEGQRKCYLTVNIKNDASSSQYVESGKARIDIKMVNYENKDVNFKFNMESNYGYPLSVGLINNEDPESDPVYTELTNVPWGSSKVPITSDFIFYLKTQDYAHWMDDYAGYVNRPEKSTLILNNLLKFDTGKIKKITSEYVENKDAYKITLEEVTFGDGNDPSETITITFNKDASGVNNINITFPDINLPENINSGSEKITIKQDDQEFIYPARGTRPYVLKATIKPTKSSIVGETTITLGSTDNFKFGSGDFDFKIGEHTFNAATLSEGACSFTVGNVSDAGDWSAFKALKTGDLDIECHCLKPKNKAVTVKDKGFLNTTVKNDKNESYTRVGGEEQGEYSTPYGSRLTIITKLGAGYSMDDPEEQVKVKDASGNEIKNWGNVTKNDQTREITVVAWGILVQNITIEFISDKNNIPITFDSAEGIDYYYANMKQEGGKNILNTDDDSSPFEKENDQRKSLKGIVTINSGNDYYFAVGVQSGYDLDHLVVKAGETTLQEYTTDGLTDEKKEGCKFYKLENVTSSVIISGKTSKRTMKVTFERDSREGETARMKYKSDNSEVSFLNVTYGNSATFTVEFSSEAEQNKYGQSNFKVYVTGESGTQELTKYQGEYKILDITENKTVYVTNVTINKYVVNFLPNSRAGFLIDGQPFQGAKTDVSYGSSIQFRIEAKAGYQLGKDTIVNYQSASDAFEITKDKGSTDRYTLSGVHENCTIAVDNIDNVTYKVTLKDVPGVTYLNDRDSVISGSMRVKYGGNFEFSVNVDDAYDDSAAGMFIILNGGKSRLHAQKLSAGHYVVSNINEDVTIKVGNIRKNTYTVTLRSEEGIDYYSPNDKMVTGDNTVNHGDSFSFRVSLYPAYSDSEIAVMLGNDKMMADSSGYYTISGVIEDKMVTVTGIHPNSEVGLINTINNLPQSVTDLNDVNPVIEASKWYNSLSDDKKSAVANADVLMNLQQQSGALLHNSDGVTVDGADWYIKLVVVPISSDMDACARIYKKLGSEYILSLYDIYLWDTLNDVKYTSYGDQVYTVTIPAPRMTNFRNPTGVHEDSDSGKVSFMDLVFSGDRVSFQTNSFSAMGIVASHDPSGASSLFDTAGAKLPWIRDYVFGGARSGSSGNDSSGNTLINDADSLSDDDGQDSGNINEKFRSMNNRVTPQGSALRLILVLMILILLAFAIWFIYKKRKERRED